MAWRRSAIAAAVTLICGAAPGVAQAAHTSVAVFSDPAEFVGAGAQLLFTPSNSTIVVQRKYGLVDVEVNPGGADHSFTLEFGAPQGRTLHRGVYDYAVDVFGRYGPRPGLTVQGDARACDSPRGRFEIRDIARGPSRSIKRLWIVFEQHCGLETPGLFGEVRYREGSRFALPGVVRWPAGEHGTVGTTVPVTLAPSHAVALRRARIVGRGHRAFRIRADDCSGRTVGGGEVCRVWVRFRGGPGTHLARLRIPGTKPYPATYGAKLDGFNWGGKTRLVMHSDKGDFIGQGADWLFTPRNAWFDRFGDAHRLSFDVHPAGDLWSAVFSAAPGDVLTRRTYANAVGYGEGTNRPSFDVSGAGRGCDRIRGSFTIKQMRFDPRDDVLRNFAASFVQHCEAGKPALRGEVDFRAGDHTKPPPWMDRPGS
jgi:hypothetical protein